MIERGVEVEYSTICRWTQAYASELDKRCRPHLRPTTDSWRVDETYVKVKQELHWHYRIRIKSNFWIERPGKTPCQVKHFHLEWGQALLLQGVRLTKTNPYSEVSLALERDPISGEFWSIVSDEPTTLQTFAEYGERFDIEENFLDDKSNGFQLERSWIRSTTTVSRLCLVLAVATLYLTAQGQQVVASGKRRWVDAHYWYRGSSYLRLGWQWVKFSLTRGWQRFLTLQLSGQPDPQPAKASQKQAEKQFLREFTVWSYSYAA